ncbi:UNVERIFIED_ORG: hypothetical protein ABIB19_003523 [Arthrobacter sp. UYEF10]
MLVAAMVVAAIPAVGLAPAALAADTGSITGNVTVPAGVDVTKIRVSAHSVSGGGSYVTANPSAAGAYSLPGLTAGEYVVQFEHVEAPNSSPVIGVYYPGLSPAEATRIPVAPGAAVTINQTLELGARISGTIAVPAGSPRFTGYVQIMTGPDFKEFASAGTWGASDFVGDTDASGNFSISGLAAGTYKVHYASYADEWATMWRGSVATPGDSTAIVLAKGQHVSGLADMAVGSATVSGTASGGTESFQPISIVASDGTVVGNATTSSTSTAYTAKRLFPGTYTVQFNRSSGLASSLEAQVYKDLPESSGLNSATRVTVASGQSQTNINAVSRAGGTLTGKIIGPDSNPLNNVPVRVYTKDGSLVTRGANTADDGTFRITGLSTGNYLVAANMIQTRPTGPLGQIFSGNARTESGATTVAATVGQNTDIGTLSYAASSTSAFSDVAPGSQFASEMNWLAAHGISTGWTEPDGSKTYRPLQPVNRDAMAAFMYRLAGKPAFTAPATSPFTDVPSGAQFYKEITWLAAQGISTGWTEPDGSKTYRPLQPVNRDAMAAFMYRLAGKPAFTAPATSPFTDVPSGAQFYKEITWLAAQGISTGWTEPDGSKTYRSLQAVNRDAMAAFMYRYNLKFGSIQ